MDHHLEREIWKSRGSPDTIIGAEANSTFACNNVVAAGDNLTEYQLVPATEPVAEGGNDWATYEDEVSYLNSFPPGYRFKPLDSELIDVYLASRVRRLPLPPNKIHEVKLYNFIPDDLAAMYEPAGDNEWYFFTSRDRKYKNGYRPNRAAGDGYWKATGADKAIKLGDRKIGSKKSLVFYRGKAQSGNKSDWIMHEFNFDGAPKIACGGNDMLLDECVLCRLHKKPVESGKARQQKESPDTSPIRDDEEQQNHQEPEAEADVPPPPPPVEANHNNLLMHNNQQQFQSNLPTLLPKQPNQQAPYIFNYEMGLLQNGSQFQIKSFPDGVTPLLDCTMYDIPDAFINSVYLDIDTQFQQLNGMINQDDGLAWSPHLPPPPPPPEQLPPPPPPRQDDRRGDDHSSDDQK